MILQTKSIDELTPSPYNPRVDLQPGEPEYEKLKRSIQEFDYIEPIVWNSMTGNVVGGHQRLKVLKDLGYQEVEVSVVSLSGEKEKALNLALNKISGDWDLPKLKDLLEELTLVDFDMDLTGFDDIDIKDLFKQFETDSEIKEDDFDTEAEAAKVTEPNTQPGDIWQLGRHRLLCGDATNLADLTRLMEGKMANMVFTDPPYNVDYTGATKDKLKILNDKMGSNQFYEFLEASFENMINVTAPGGAVYICHADSEGYNFRKAFVDAGFLLKQCIIWVKNTIVMGRQDYHWQHEPIIYGWKPGAAHSWYGGRKESTTWNIDKPLRNGEHPTMKPIQLVARALKNSSQVGELVLDMFLGSGSTLIAAEQSNRICYGMELDPVYCDVIIKRWEQLTGQKAVKAN